jgi:hypothetical protein
MAVNLDMHELEEIALKEIKSVISRAKMLSLVAVANKAGLGDLERSELEGDHTAEAIASWIERTWPNQTVRAKMAQKIAKMVREGDWKE